MASVDVEGQKIKVDGLLVANLNQNSGATEDSLVVAGRSAEIEWKKTGQLTEIPENNTAKLMYYLDCLLGVVNMKSDYNLHRLRQFEYYGCLNHQERIILLKICANDLNPYSLEGRCLKETNSPDIGPNEFYEIKSKEVGFAADENIMIAGRICEVQKIMLYRSHWMERNYYEPLEGLLREMQAIRQGDRDGCCGC